MSLSDVLDRGSIVLGLTAKLGILEVWPERTMPHRNIGDVTPAHGTSTATHSGPSLNGDTSV